MDKLDPEVILGMAAQAPDGVVIVDSDNLIRYWNRGAERIFGFSAAEADGRSLDVIIPEKHRRRQRLPHGHGEGCHQVRRGGPPDGSRAGGGRPDPVHRVQRGAAGRERRRVVRRGRHPGRHGAARPRAGDDAAAVRDRRRPRERLSA
ncbi:PAS domain-containing protein [Streptomyces sp. NBC_00647]|uniref:PAS domain-containing protein n=1 Tax=Streptomyces sp. NBC_00647 TaxID=2975796 RepID=UPI003865DF5F